MEMINDQQQGRIVAEEDAKADVNPIIWIGIGLLLNIVGVLIACAYKPSLPVSRILGKSQKYTLFYEAAYRSKVRHFQTTYAGIGFFTPFVFALTGFLLRVFFPNIT